MPVVPAEHRRHERGPDPYGRLSGYLSGYFSSRVTLAAAAGAASTVTAVVAYVLRALPFAG